MRFISQPLFGLQERLFYIHEALVKVFESDETKYSNLFFTNDNQFINQRKRRISVYFQNEHTIKFYPINQSSINIAPTNISYIYDKSQNYSIDFQNTFTTDADLIIDYSYLNVYNFQSSGYYPNDLLRRIAYIPPIIDTSICFLKYKSQKREIELLTTFFLPEMFDGHRSMFLRKMLSKNINITNSNNISHIDSLYSIRQQLSTLLLKTKILINIHQSVYWGHTFEEIRVLPALLSKVVVISETSPLQDKLPYYDYIIWSNLDDMEVTIKHVRDNYEFYYNKFYDENSQLSFILEKMKLTAIRHLKDSIDYILETRNIYYTV